MPSIANSRPVVPEENNFWANQTIHGDINNNIPEMYYDSLITGCGTPPFTCNGYRINNHTTINILTRRVFGNSFLMNDTNIWMIGKGSPRLKSISELQNIHDRNKDMSAPTPYATNTSYPSLGNSACEECVEVRKLQSPEHSFDALAMEAAIQNGDGIVMLDPNAKDLENAGTDDNPLMMYGGKFGYVNGILTRFLYDQRYDDMGANLGVVTNAAYWSSERTIPGFGQAGGMRYFESSDAAQLGLQIMPRRGMWFTPTSSALSYSQPPPSGYGSWMGDNTSSFAESFCSGANYIGSGFNFTHSLDRSTIYMRTQMCTGSRIWNVPASGKLYIVKDITRDPHDPDNNTIRWKSDEFSLPTGATNKGDTAANDCYDEGDIGYYYSHEYINKYNLYSSTIRLFSGSFGGVYGQPPTGHIGYDISFDPSLEVKYGISSSRYFTTNMSTRADAYWNDEEKGGYQPATLKWSTDTSSVGHIDQDPQTGLAHAFQGPSSSYHATWSMHMPFDPHQKCFLPIPLNRNWNIFTTHSNGTPGTNKTLATWQLFGMHSREDWLEGAPYSGVSWKNRRETTYTKRPNCTCNPITEWFNRPLTATHRNTSSMDDEADDIINWVYTLTFSDGYVFSCGAFLRLISYNPLHVNAGTPFQNSVVGGAPNIPMYGSENWPKDITTRTVGRLYSHRKTHFLNNTDYSNPNMAFVKCSDIIPGTTKTGGFLYLTDITRQNPSEYMYHYNVALDEYQFKIAGDESCNPASFRKSQLMPHGTIINTDWPKSEYGQSIFNGCVMIENGLYVLFEGGEEFRTPGSGDADCYTDGNTIQNEVVLPNDA